ncbi:hypothetical protein CVD28_03060 [Bacillus sp. M6-12]|uniref:hypothetical protein n=1 Tax=Bacillus sp. M6-12 TaxID=2054166 RepID=UPI000C755C89|nr:hypothetical protein [Bacillus sp. M6-12]PLS19409.1 hypothetical protein CVD28_03060 [Bacillus sp. M6-12]
MQTLDVSKNGIVMNGIVQEGSVQYMIYPFYSDKLKEWGKVITFSEYVDRAKMVYCGEERVGLILPYREGDNILKTLKRYQEKVKMYVGMQITIFSLYDFNGNKLRDIEFFKEGYWF